jgi:hypothetical protein
MAITSKVESAGSFIVPFGRVLEWEKFVRAAWAGHRLSVATPNRAGAHAGEWTPADPRDCEGR